MIQLTNRNWPPRGACGCICGLRRLAGNRVTPGGKGGGVPNEGTLLGMPRAHLHRSAAGRGDGWFDVRRWQTGSPFFVGLFWYYS